MKLEQALEMVHRSSWALSPEEVGLGEAQGRYLAEVVHSDLDLPPFNRSMLDGFACRASDLPGPMRQVATVMAGESAAQPLPEGCCARVMTGAPAPEGADYVFGIENAETQADGIVFTGTRSSHGNIAFRAEDVSKGDAVLQPGCRLLPQHLAVLATVGRTQVRVMRRPSVGILATGSELVPVEVQPTGAQIRNSNSQQLAALARAAGCRVTDYGIIHDERDLQREALRIALENHDLVLSTGGVSVGDRDYIPELLAELGVDIHLRKVDIQPGKPIVFGTRRRSREGTSAKPQDSVGDVATPVAAFALAGNPLSSYVQFLLLVQPFLAALQGGHHRTLSLTAPLAEAVSRANAARALYRPMRLNADGTASPLHYHGSGHLTSYVDADALGILPEGILALSAGDSIALLLLS